MRGTVFDSQEIELSKKAQDYFGMFMTARTLSVPDLYAGKICAALDRQHPRDLFDIKFLLENDGVTDSIRKAFVVYLASHNGSMCDLLNPNEKDILSIYENEFVGMIEDSVGCSELVQVRKSLIHTIQTELTNEERRFLLSIKQAKPEWNLLGIEGLEKLPAIQWKLNNIQKLPTQKHKQLINKLKSILQL